MIRPIFVAVALSAVTACSDGGRDAVPAVPAVPPESAARAPEIHPGTGLVVAEGWELVASHCTSCHSTRHLRQQRGTRRAWQDAIDWMKDTQGVPEFPPGVEDRIVTYLAAHYGSTGPAPRRDPLPPALMPADPYARPVDAK